jgi:8-hydroxy-5-deazaflavin:NADPH oxidoreductase
MLGTRDPAKLQPWRAGASPDAHVGRFEEAARFGDLVVLSVLGSAAEDVVRHAGIENFNGKVVLDATDPLDFSSGRPGLFVGTTDSLGERIQRLLPQAHVVKGLNTVVAEVMVDPTLSGGDPDMFIAVYSHRTGKTHHAFKLVGK